MPKPLPMPIHIIYNSPGWMMSEPLAQGALARVIFPWWLSGCHPLPMNEDIRLQELSGLGASRWKRIGSNVKHSLGLLIPELQKLYVKMKDGRDKMSARNKNGAKALVEYNRKRRAERLERKRFSEADKDISLVSGRVDAQLPSRIEDHGQHTPNSFKHRPPKSQGTLRDK